MKYNVQKAVKRVITTHEKKLKRLTRNVVLPFTSTETVTNLSSQNLTSEQLEILKYGPSHSICPSTISKTDVFSCFELINRTMVRNILDRKLKGKLVADLSHLAHSYVSSHQPSAADLKKYRVLKNLRRNKDIVILKPDKGNGLVVMDRKAYEQGILSIISDTSKFKVNDNDPTLQREGKLQRFLRTLKSKGHLDKNTYERIYPVGSQPARFYGLPKMHKARGPNETPPFRPIVSSIGTYNYNLSKFLCNLLEPHVPHEYNVRDTFSFVHEINQLSTSGKFMVSFDVESLFTSIPLDECIDIAIRYIYQGNPGLKINAADLRRLFAFATAETGFLFAGVFYDQIDGVAMGSPLAPVLANLFMGHHEKTWLDNYSLSEVVFYRRYVDDTFCLFNNEKDAVLFFDYLNTRHPSIRFTMEKEINEKLSFLDILIDNSNPSIITSVYRKKTFTGLLTNYFSFTPMMYKLGLIRTLVDRVYKINNSWVGFHKDVQKLIFLLRKNCFPSSVIDRIISRHLAKSYNPSPTHNATLNSGNPSSHYFKLPYVGRFSDIAQTKLRHLLKRYCRPDLDIKLVFNTFKLRNLFSVKDSVPPGLRSRVVYKFSCAGCNASYIGETTRHICTRVREHLLSDKTSHIYKHLQSSKACLDSCGTECFTILDSAASKYKIKIKEALHIKWDKPILNQQLKHLELSLSF